MIACPNMPAASASIDARRPRGPRAVGAACAVALHALAAVALLSYQPSRQALIAVVPVMVHLITPPKIETRPQPPVEIPPAPRLKPRRVVKPVVRQPDPPPQLAAPVEAPTPVEVAPPPPPPPPPEPAPIVAAVPPPPVPVTAPIFSANYLENPPPRYPAVSRRLGEQGRVVLRVRVNERGSADAVEIRRSSGHPRLDDAARETVLRWRFVPAKRGEQPVAAWVLIPVSFRLEG